jgi:ABC-type dipeptide/oligopeptide/nickel transport system permease component
MSRSAMLEVLGLDYVQTARAKGLDEWLVIAKHALKNAAIPIVTVIGLQFGVLLGGALVTETVFAIPGTGRLIFRAIGQLDFPVVQAGVMMLSLIIVAVNFVVDLLYLYLNPQVRIS